MKGNLLFARPSEFKKRKTRQKESPQKNISTRTVDNLRLELRYFIRNVETCKQNVEDCGKLYPEFVDCISTKLSTTVENLVECL
jgi:predicted YcjX-like family ATPase